MGEEVIETTVKKERGKGGELVVVEETTKKKILCSDTAMIFLLTNESKGEYVNSHNIKHEGKADEKIIVNLPDGYLPNLPGAGDDKEEKQNDSSG